ncbi:MAG: 16S rRNA (uracil(1498)-N(3))-methyltransferase [Caulobacteraceae bacterium]|nr:16S rRNA (uracil(1498)-N(3))-methyltransferase [Caulobacteraceae bacterium]
MIRLFVPDDLSLDVAVAPSPEQARYLTSVMRLGLGDEVALFNGRDGEWLAKLSLISKRACQLTIERQVAVQTEGLDLDLVVALVKRGPLETIVEKAVELGCRRIRLVTTRRTNAGHVNVERLQAIATEAAEQCERLDVPQVLSPQPLEALLNGWDTRRLMFCDEAGDAQPVLSALAGQGSGPWAVLIGPEGGFAPEERARLRALVQVVPVTLGPRILRADTAAISAISLWQAVLGDWSEAKG